VPADVIRVAGEILSLAEELEPIGNPNVITDVAAAAEAARAAATTARVNVEVNLGGIAEKDIVAELRTAVAGVDDLAIRAEKVTVAVRDRLAR
jgi:formiminotetrahydrofolate cyclodeaminase